MREKAYKTENIITSILTNGTHYDTIFLDAYLRDADVGYTVVPMPKLDESVEQYSGLVHDDTNVIAMTANVPDPDAVCAAVTRRAKYGYYEVMPEYYDVTLKIKYSRTDDDRYSRMIDLIHDSFTTDFSYVNNYSMNNMICLWREICISKKHDFLSTYKQMENSYQSGLEKLLDAFENY